MAEKRTVTVTCEGQRKRMQLTLQSFDDIKETIRKRLNFDTEEMSIKAILDGDKDEYDITDDDQLREVWNKLKELRIIPNQLERLRKKTVEIDGVHYRIDVPMAADSPIVQGYSDEYHLGDFIEQMKAMTAVMGLSYIETVANGNRKLINGITDICFSTRQICGDTRLLMSGYEQTCSRVIETFQCMILYINENNRERAVESYAEVGKFVIKRCKDTRRLIGDIEKTLVMMRAFTSEIAGVEDKIGETLQENTKEMRETDTKLRLEMQRVNEIDEEIGETISLEDKRKRSVAKDVDAWSAKADVVGQVAIGLAQLAQGAGTIITAPRFFLDAIHVLGKIACEVKTEKEGQKNREQIQLYKLERRKLEQKKSELKATLKELRHKAEPTMNLGRCLQVAQMYINVVKRELQNLQTGWTDVESICKAMNQSKQLQHTVEEEDYSKIFEPASFRQKVVRYYARWVALKAFARQCNESLAASQKKLDDRTTLNITRKEAKALLQKAAEDEEFLCLMGPEPCEDRDNTTE